MADLSIEETNRIRLSLGLKPLPVPSAAAAGPSFKPSKASSDSSSDSEDEPGSTLESRQAQGYENWKKLQDEQSAKAQRDAKNAAIKKARDLARKFTKLEGKGLGEADDVTELDTKAWLVQQKKRQKKLEKERARRLEQELRDREEAHYGAEDLAGVKVGHEVDEFEGEGEQILVLKDATIDENEEEGDELENIELREKEKLGERLNLKKRKPVYDPNAADETGDNTMLKHYDETIDGKKRKRFTLDAKGSTQEERDAMKKTVGARLKAEAVSLDILKDDTPISDYIDASEIKIKKPKNKKSKSKRQKAADEDDIFPEVEISNGGPSTGAMDVDAIAGHPVAPARSHTENFSFVDDDDMQSMLAKQRREALKKRKKMKPEDLAKQLREEEYTTPMETDNATEVTPGLIIDETSEFVANLQRHTEEPRKPQGLKVDGKSTPKPLNDKADIDMDCSYADLSDNEDHKPSITSHSPTPEPSSITGTGLDAEHTLNVGIGSTLSLLTQRGLITHNNASNLSLADRERARFLAEKRAREAQAEAKARIQRERDRASGKLDRMSAREREEHARFENKQRDQAESRAMVEVFAKEYKPDVQLKYVDEFGRSMSQKEAFKHLSHQFHGKGSGKQKTEKHLKKIEEEHRREAKSVLDGQVQEGMGRAVGGVAKREKTVGVRLA